MKRYMDRIKSTRLFSGVKDEDVLNLLPCLNGHVKEFSKGEHIITSGEYIDNVMLLLSGQLSVEQEDYWGNRNIIALLNEGDIFGEAYLAPDSGVFNNDVVAERDSIVMFLDGKRLMTPCNQGCGFHVQAYKNLLYALSEKTRRLMGKLEVVTKRNTRTKLITYLSEMARINHSSVFDIPFNRQQLADYLAVDRSAMSNELCKMRDEGLLNFDKNHFELLRIAE